MRRVLTFSASASLVAGLGLGGPLVSVGCSSSSTPATQPTKDAATAVPDAGKDVTTHHADAEADAGKPKPHKDAGSDAATVMDAAVDGPPVYPVPASWNQAYTQPSDTAAAADRQACKFKRGDMPAQTTGTSTALGSKIPVDHIVVLMQENRSFDSYLGHLQAYEATKGIHNTIESASPTATNPDYPQDQLDGGGGHSDAGVHPWVHAPQLCFFDTAHSWGAAHLEYDKGLNDGFFYANNGTGDTGEMTTGIAPAQLTGDRAMWWYDETDLPFYYELYSSFAMADHYHSALLGSTYPNRYYLYSATSFGKTSNDFPDISKYPTPETPVIIFDELAVRGVSFTWYTDGVAAEESVFGMDPFGQAGPSGRYGSSPTSTITQFLADAASGNLPAVSFIDGDNLNETTTGNDEHPPSEIEQGQQFVWQIVNAVTTGKDWGSTALFITYDENGGIYDHVAPPAACKPDDIAPVLTDPLDQSQPGQFDRYGFRVPFVVVSPFAKKSFVSHTTYSHTSIARFIEARFTLPALTARDANEDPFTDMFDWQSPPWATPPVFKKPTIDAAAVSKCTTELTPP